MSDEEMDEIVQEFLIETTENLDQLDSDLVALERDPGSRELLAGVFRTIHTIKGATGFLGFDRLEGLSHAAENLLSKLRDGELPLTTRRADALLDVVDAIRGLLAAIEGTGHEDERDLSALVALLSELQQPDEPVAVDVPAVPVAVDVPDEPAAVDVPAVPVAVDVPDEPAAVDVPAVPVAVDVPAAPVAVDVPVEPVAVGVPAAPAPVGIPEERSRGAEPYRSAGDLTVRVDVDLLDALMRQVGELVLARNQITSHVGAVEDHVLHQTVQRLSLIVSELQEGVMKTRMQPIDQLWAKLPRVVRDLATQFSKDVVLDLEGGETELDRSLLEAVKDPFTHLVRNAIDHGIEAPGDRVAAGKPRAGTLSLRAFHEGGQVVLSVADDGRGIDPAVVGPKAVERGLITADQLASMGERDIVDLIFRPGFSTAAVVTNVSGRGVGMDVVRTNIEGIGGTVDVTSAPGEGTAFRIKIPLTLAIIPALLVSCRGERYAIPQASLLEMVQLEGEQARTGIEYIGRAAVYRLRGRLLPLVWLDEMLGHERAGSSRRSISIIVLQADDVLFGVVVDAVLESQEIVVKPLGRHVKHIPLFAGATILGDGGVALILDVLGLAVAAEVHEAGAGRQSGSGGEPGPGGAGDVAADGTSLVVLRVGEHRRVALPLDAVARLEEVPAALIEHAGGRPVVQYRGDLLPLVWLDTLVGEAGERPEDGAPDTADGQLDGGAGQPIVVYAEGGRQIGLVATEILDIVDGAVEASPVGAGRGVVGSAVVQGRVTDLLDVHAAYLAAWGEVAEHAG